MKLRYLTVGFGSQIGLLILFAVMGLGKLSETVYWPWFLLGEWVFPSGAGGHAMPGGAILGFLFGMFVYSLIIGVGITYFTRPKSQLR
jgi:hypothetical protein